MSKKLSKNIFLTCFSGLFGVYNFFARESQVAVLMYHSVGRSGWEFSVSPEVFEKQINYLRRNNYKFLTAKDLDEIISGKDGSVKKGVLITFDDGYRDFMTEAAPILNKYGIPAILFVHTDRSSDRLGNDLPLLTWPEIRSLGGSVETGSHSHSHPDLKALSREELNQELDQAEETFVRELGYKPELLSYPGGRFSFGIADNLRQRGYKLAFTINPGLIRKKNDPLVLPRFGISVDTSFIEFKARITGASNWYEMTADLFRSKNKKKFKI